MGPAPCGGNPHLSAERLQDLLFRAYREFFAPEDNLAKMLHHRWKGHWFVNASIGLGYAAFARLAAAGGCTRWREAFGGSNSTARVIIFP
jgi:hypothetical protein